MKVKNTMLDYIRETSSVGKAILLNQDTILQQLSDRYISSKCKKIVIIASGSSFNASMTARLLMEKNLKVEVKVITPFEFENYETNFLDDAFVFTITQSGRSTNILSAIDKLNEMSIDTITLTGFPDSEVRKHSKIIIDLHIGVETVGYVTKGFTSSVLFLMLFSKFTAQKLGLIDTKEVKEQETSILDIFDTYNEAITTTIDFYKKHKSIFLRMKRLQICGYGPNYGTATEGALKIGETYGIPATPYDLEEFMHGGYLELTPESVVILIDSDGKGHKRTMELYNALQFATKKVFVIGSMKLPQNDHFLRVKEELNEWTSPLILVMLFQILAHMICTDLDIWEKEAYIDEFEREIASKTEKPDYLK